MWLLPCLILGLAILLAVPLGLYMARVLDRPTPVNVVERWIDTGGQNWKQYCLSLLLFNGVVFVLGFLILALQPWLPLNPDDKKMLAPSTIFNTACSFVTNTNLQHYSGEVHLSYFSQLFFVCWKQFVTPAVGLAALLALVRGLRGDLHLGNFYLDTWRGVAYVFVPLSLAVAVMLSPLAGMIGWAVCTDTMEPNPALTARAEEKGDSDALYRVGLPVDQAGVGNLEGKELRFGPGAGPTWAACTTGTSN